MEEDKVQDKLIELFSSISWNMMKEFYTNTDDRDIFIHANPQGHTVHENGTIYRFIVIGFVLGDAHPDVVFCEQFAFIDHTVGSTILGATKIYAEVANGNRKRTIAHGDWDNVSVESDGDEE